MTDLTLYTNPMSRGRIARWMLEEVGQPYEAVIVQFGDETIRAANPMGKVPTIVHGDTTVTEAAAICAYLADAFPDAGLAPATGDRGAYYRWLFFAAGPLEQAVVSKSLGWEVPDDKQALVGFGSYDRTIDTLEEEVAAVGDAWLTGDRFTAADLYVGAHLSWGLAFGSIPKRDAFAKFVERVSARPAAVRANELDDALIAEMKAD